YDWASKINAAQQDDSIQNVVVIGSGYIGVEATQVFTKAGKSVTLIDMLERPLGNYLNAESTEILEQAFVNAGVNLHMGASVEAFLGEGRVQAVKTDKA
ncbi:FAD-dependent oxidoreductase, partial [Streptococcus danieliae]|nr:FAD-dependent oxidoreductase [Streptococcus danieliae]